MNSNTLTAVIVVTIFIAFIVVDCLLVWLVTKLFFTKDSVNKSVDAEVLERVKKYKAPQLVITENLSKKVATIISEWNGFPVPPSGPGPLTLDNADRLLKSLMPLLQEQINQTKLK